MNYKDYFPYLVYLFLNLITYIFIKLTSYSLSSTFNAIFSLLSISSFLLLVRTKQDPGEIEINSKGILERQITLSDSSIKLKYTPLMIMKLMPCNGCKFCKISELPLRSNHCEKCERCIRKYDHHCKLIGGCIGENNHLVFLMFGYIAIIGFIVSVFGIYFIFHIYLLLTNQTTYEIFHKNQCPYLRIFKQERIKIYLDRGIELGANFSFHPFDSGIRKNIGYAFYKLFNTDGMKWEDIYFRNLKSNHVKFDYCDNKILSAF